MECFSTWGDGPDVLLVNKGNSYVLYDHILLGKFKYGESFKGSIGLTLNEAKELMFSLSNAINKTEKIIVLSELLSEK